MRVCSCAPALPLPCWGESPDTVAVSLLQTSPKRCHPEDRKVEEQLLENGR